MTELNRDTFEIWLWTAFDWEKVKSENEIDEDLSTIPADGSPDETIGVEGEYECGPFFGWEGVWLSRGVGDETTEDILKKYPDTERYKIVPGEKSIFLGPPQVYLKYTEKNIEDIQKEAEEWTEQKASISLRDFLDQFEEPEEVDDDMSLDEILLGL